jgi:hypothetical protein
MAKAESGPWVANARATTWELALGPRLPLPHFATGALVAVLLLGLQLGYLLLFDYPIWDAEQGRLFAVARSALIFAVLVGYALGAFWSTREAVVREFEAYGAEAQNAAFIRDEPGEFEFSLDAVRASRWAGGAAVALGVAIGVGLALIIDDFGAGTPGVAATGLLFMWILGRIAYFTLLGASEAAGARSGEIRVDLLNLLPLDRFGRIGLRLALAWLVGISIFALLSFLFPFFGAASAWLVMIPAFLSTVLVAMLALMIPVRGVRQRIREAKQAALAELEDELRRTRDAAVKGDLRIQGHLSDLLAYRAFVEGLREWPFDTRTLVRFALYTLIPVGSWLGGALVERLLDAALG